MVRGRLRAGGRSIAVASVVCNATDHFDRFFPIMALIVGIHSFPLARLFRHRAHYLTGALLCLVGLIALLAVPVSVTMGGASFWSGRWWSALGAP